MSNITDEFDRLFGTQNKQDQLIDLNKFDHISSNPKYQSNVYKVADLLTNEVPNKAMAREVAKYVPNEDRDKFLDTVYELAARKKTVESRSYPGKVSGAVWQSVLETVGAGKRILSTEASDPELDKFANRLSNVWKSADKLTKEDALWYDATQWPIQAGQAAGPMLFAGGAGRIAGAGAKVLGASERTATWAGRGAAGAAFAPQMYEETYDNLIESGVSPERAKWAAGLSSGIRSAIFATLPEKILPKSWSVASAQNELAKRLVQRSTEYAKTVGFTGPATMASAQVVDDVFDDWAKEQPPDVRKYLHNAAETWKHSYGTFAVLSAPGAFLDITAQPKYDRTEIIKKERIAGEIDKAIRDNVIPSRNQLKDWGIKIEGKNNRENRYTAIRKFSNQFEQEKAAAGFYLGENITEDTKLPQTQPTETEVQQKSEQQPELKTAETQQPEVKAEEVGKEPLVTSLKKEIVNNVRQQRGDEALEPKETESFKQWYNDAETKIKSDPTYSQRLVTELRETKRQPTAREKAALNIHYGYTNKGYNFAVDTLKKAQEGGDPVEIERASRDANIALNNLREIEEVNNRGTTEVARALVSSKMTINEDMSPGAIATRMSVAKLGKELTPEETTKISEMSSRISELENQLKSFKENKVYKQTINELKPKKSIRKTSAEKLAAKKKIGDAWDELSGIVKEKHGSIVNLFKSETGAFDPAVLQSAVKLAKAYIDYGRTTFSEFYAGVREKYGKDVAEQSKELWAAAWNSLKQSGDTPLLNIDASKPNEISRQARKISSALIESGVTEWADIRDAVTEELRQVIPDITPERVADAIVRRGEFKVPRKPVEPEAYKKGLYRRIAEYSRKKTEKDVARKEKPQRVLDKEELGLRFQLAKEKAKVKKMEYDLQQEQKPTWQKVINVPREAVRTQRAILSSYDMSAVYRQAGIAAFGRPTLVGKNIKEQFKALLSEKEMFRVMQEIEDRPHSKDGSYERHGLGLTTTEGRLEQMEELFIGEFARKFIPGVRASERAYVTLLNKTRADLYDTLVDSMPEGKVTDPDGKAIANYVNVVTGRGKLSVLGKSFENAAVPAADVLFSPRLTFSRFQWLLGQPLFQKGMSWQARKVIAKEYARTLIGMGTFLGAVSLSASILFSDDDPDKPRIELDPRSSKFGKVQIGNTLIDPLAGLSQSTVLLSRLTTGKTKSKTGEIVPLRGEDIPFKGMTTTDVITRFLRGKLSPALGNTVDIIQGENVVGEKVTPQSFISQSIVPLAMRDIYESMREQGIPRGTALGLMAVFGVGIQNYEQAQPGDFAKKIAQHRKLIGYNPKTMQGFNYQQEVSDIIKEARRLGISEYDLKIGLVQKLKEKGIKSDTISEQKKRLRKRLIEQK